MQFLFPAYLYALALVAIPIIIHFFHFQRVRRVPFTNVAALAQVQQASRSRNRLKHLLILLARMAFVTCLVLAFARPFLPSPQHSEATSNYVSVYLDNSFSLQNERDGKRLLDLGLTYTEQLVGAFAKNAFFQLVLNDFEVRGNAFFEGSKMTEKTSDLDFANVGRSLPEVWTRQAEALHRHSPYQRGNHVFWISDFQKNTIGDPSKLDIDSLNRFYLLPLTPPATANLFVDSVWLEVPFVQIEENNAVAVQVVNAGTEPAEDKSVKLFVDGKEVSGTTLSIPAKGSAIARLNFSIAEAGEKACRIAIEDFPIAFDNEHFFVLKVAPKIRIATLSERKGSTLPALFGTEAFFEAKHFTLAAPDYDAIEAADLIVLENLSTFDKALAQSLRKAVSTGSTIALFPGEQPDLTAYADVLRLSFGLQKAGAAPVWQDIQAPDPREPLYESVFEKLSPNMAMPRAAVLLLCQSPARVILRLKDGTPFLSAVQVPGAARIFVFGSPTDSRFTDFDRHALFVPTLYKIALASKSKVDRLAYSFDEQTAAIALDSLDKSDVFKLVSGQVEHIPAQRSVGNTLYLSMPKGDLPAGIYSLCQTKTNRCAGLIAFNYGHQESQPECYTADELRSLFESRPNVEILDIGTPDQLDRHLRQATKDQNLWRWFVIAALAFLLVEVLLIRWWK